MNNTYERLLELVLNDGRTDEAGAKRLARVISANLRRSGGTKGAIGAANRGEYTLRQTMRGRPTDTKELRGREPTGTTDAKGRPVWQENERTADVEQIRAKAAGRSSDGDPLAAKKPGSVAAAADRSRPSRLRQRLAREYFGGHPMNFVRKRTPI